MWQVQNELKLHVETAFNPMLHAQFTMYIAYKTGVSRMDFC